jgi:hypothetical protein
MKGIDSHSAATSGISAGAVRSPIGQGRSAITFEYPFLDEAPQLRFDGARTRTKIVEPGPFTLLLYAPYCDRLTRL